MQIKVIASGSRGNCYNCEYESGTGVRRLLLDAGLRYSEILEAINFDIASIDGVLVSHEHADHAKAVPDLLANGIDVYMSAGTLNGILDEDDYLRNMAEVHKVKDQFTVGPWMVIAFKAEHDAAEPLGFLLYHQIEKIKILYLTDSVGCKYRFVGLTHIMIECNYVLEVINSNLRCGEVNKPLTDRILRSHIGLETLIPWLKGLDLSNLRKIILVHISDRNSDVDRMKKEVEQAAFAETIIARAGQVIDLDQCGF